MVEKASVLLSFDADAEKAREACEALGSSFEPYPLAGKFYDFSRRLPKNAKMNVCLPNTYLDGFQKAVPDAFLEFSYFDGNLRVELSMHGGTENDIDMLYAMRFKNILEPLFGMPLRIELDRPPRQFRSVYALSAQAP